MNDENKIQIINDPINETRYIEDVIKQKYFLDGFLSFENFLVSISDIEGVEITAIDTNTQFEWVNLDTLSLNAQIDCNEDDDNINYCASIQQQSKKTNDFYDRVADDLRGHYNNQQIEFSSQNGNALIIDCKDCEEEPPDYVLYGLAAIGLFVGAVDGENDGATDGLNVGLLVGDAVGAGVGENVGYPVGAGVGAADGLLVGAMDGAGLGENEGAKDELNVGVRVGAVEGLIVGAGVGLAVSAVGEDVGA